MTFAKGARALRFAAFVAFLGSVGTLVSACSGVGSPADSTAGGGGPITEGQSVTYGSMPAGNLVSASPSSGQAGDNQVDFLIGPGAVCGNYGSGGTLNQPCTSVTICLPGSTTQCQTISDILVDTGSYGLRVFASALYQNLIQGLTQISDSKGNPISECAQFGTGEDWGPVMTAGVQLGTEPVVQTSIQVINRSFSYAPGACSQADTSPSAAGFNGILGVGLLQYDCGPGCATQAGLGNLYFSCSGATCSGVDMPLASQVQNPVGVLPTDNNGVTVSIPSVPGDQASSIEGSLFLGIGTQEDNTPPEGVTVYSADDSAEFNTNFNSQAYDQSFIDSGSNVLFFPDPSLGVCDSSSNAPGFFCPGSTQPLTATNQSMNQVGTRAMGSPGPTIDFSIANASDLVQGNDDAFDDIGADSSSSGFPDSFDWGLPFFYGRTVYVGIDGASATVNGNETTGPYWAY